MTVKELLSRAVNDGVRLLAEDEGKALITRFGVAVPSGRRVLNRCSEAMPAGTRIGLPRWSSRPLFPRPCPQDVPRRRETLGDPGTRPISVDHGAGA